MRKRWRASSLQVPPDKTSPNKQKRNHVTDFFLLAPVNFPVCNLCSENGKTTFGLKKKSCLDLMVSYGLHEGVCGC